MSEKIAEVKFKNLTGFSRSKEPTFGKLHVTGLKHKLASYLNSSLSIPACLRIAKKVPFGKSLFPCKGTITVLFVTGLK